MKGIKMKKILKYSTILGAAAFLSYTPVASADTGGYVRVKGFDSHFHSLGFGEAGCKRTGAGGFTGDCKFASGLSDRRNSGTDGGSAQGVPERENKLGWTKDDGTGLVAGADFGFFRLEIEGGYQESDATEWRDYTATSGKVHVGRLFGNIVVEPLDLLELLGEFGGIEPLVKYNPAHYGISPYAMYGTGIMGGLVEDLGYSRACDVGHSSVEAVRSQCAERGAFGGGATAAVNVGAGVNIGLDQLARAFSDFSGTSLPEYFKLPIEISVGYHFQVGLDEYLFESMNEDLGIDDDGLTYSVGLKW
tara:strand:+ start:553 stop:1467 length:915 start_codon:yes stop_codon:yes gene_type:complete